MFPWEILDVVVRLCQLRTPQSDAIKAQNYYPKTQPNSRT